MWSTSGQIGYKTPAVGGVPNTSNGGQNQKWTTIWWISCITCAVLCPRCFNDGDKIKSGPQVGGFAT